MGEIMTIRRIFLIISIFSVVYSTNMVMFIGMSSFGVVDMPLNSKIPSYLNLSQLPDFWSDLKDLDQSIPLNMTVITTELKNYTNKVAINYTEVKFTSHFFEEHPVRIFSRIYFPYYKNLVNVTFPAVVLVHGILGDSSDVIEFAMSLAANNYTVLALDLPGHGGYSTGVPGVSPDTLVNITQTPKNSNLYHSAVAVYRAISVLTTLDVVDKDRIGLVGGSFGGVMTFYVTALDSRVKTAVPLLAAGNWERALKFQGYVAGLIPPNAAKNETHIRLFLQYFDPLVYAAHLKVPTFMMIGTYDEFFPIDTFNLTYSIIPQGVEKNLAIVPTQNHAAFSEIANTTLLWLDHILKKKNPFPRVEITKKRLFSLFGEKLSLQIQVSDIPFNLGEMKINLGYKEDVSGFAWKVRRIASLSAIELQSTYFTKTTFGGYVIPLREYFVITATFGNGVVVSSTLQATKLFHTAFIPTFGVFIAFFSLICVYVVQNIKKTLHNIEKVTYVQKKMELMIYYVFGSLIEIMYITSLIFLSWLKATGTIVHWTVFKFFDLFFHQDIFVYATLILFIVGFVLWFAGHPIKASVVQIFIPLTLTFFLFSLSLSLITLDLGFYITFMSVLLLSILNNISKNISQKLAKRYFETLPELDAEKEPV